jgi:hypothetical protein
MNDRFFIFFLTVHVDLSWFLYFFVFRLVTSKTTYPMYVLSKETLFSIVFVFFAFPCILLQSSVKFGVA